jgi:hypothetical protein
VCFSQRWDFITLLRQREKGLCSWVKLGLKTNNFGPVTDFLSVVWVKNAGGEPVENVFRYFEVRLVRLGSDPDASDREIHTTFLKNALRQHAKLLDAGAQGMRIGKGDGVWTTMQIPPLQEAPLPQSQIDEIMQGRIRIYVYTWLRWRDAPHDFDFCEWLQPPPTTEIDNAKLIWHVCAE